MPSLSEMREHLRNQALTRSSKAVDLNSSICSVLSESSMNTPRKPQTRIGTPFTSKVVPVTPLRQAASPRTAQQTSLSTPTALRAPTQSRPSYHKSAIDHQTMLLAKLREEFSKQKHKVSPIMSSIRSTPRTTSHQPPTPSKPQEDLHSTVAELKHKLRDIQAERSAFLQEGVFDLVQYLYSTNEPSADLPNDGVSPADLSQPPAQASASADDPSTSWAQQVITTLSGFRREEVQRQHELVRRVKFLEDENRVMREALIAVLTKSGSSPFLSDNQDSSLDVISEVCDNEEMCDAFDEEYHKQLSWRTVNTSALIEAVTRQFRQYLSVESEYELPR